MKNANTTGIVIIACVLGFAGMKAFDIEYNLNNLKIMGSIVVSVVIGLVLLFGMKSKSHHDPHYYHDPDEEEKERLRYENQIAPPEEINRYNNNGNIAAPEEEPNRYNTYQPAPEEQNRYNAYQASVPPEEDNRWN